MNKVYGQSVVMDAQEKAPNVLADIVGEQFAENNFTAEEIESMRNELKSDTDSEKVAAKISTDAVTGTRVEAPINTIDKVEDDIMSKDIRTLNILPPDLVKNIKTLMGIDLSLEQQSKICDYMKKRYDAGDYEIMSVKYDMTISTEEIKNLLGKEICEVVKGVAKSKDDEESILRRLFEQIDSAYMSSVKATDDMLELTSIARNTKIYIDKVKEDEKMSKEDINKDPEKSNEMFDNLVNAKNWMEKYLEAKRNLDDRQKRMRPDYSMDDMDCKVVEEYKVAVEDALEFKTIKNFVTQNKEMFVKTFKDVRGRNNTVENWLSDIISCPNTLYTLPVNADTNTTEIHMNLKNFIYNAMVVSLFPEDIIYEDDAGIAYMEKGLMTSDDVQAFRIKSELIVFAIAKTFKYKKLSNVYMRRQLSYTLDMISKIVQYSDKIMDLGAFLFEVERNLI